MAAFMIIYGVVTDPERLAEYGKAVLPLIAQFGGRLMAHTDAPVSLEGPFDWREVTVFEWATSDAARRFWSSEAYALVKPIRDGAADLQVVLIDGLGS